MLYHLTDEASLKNILRNGLEPRLGDNSRFIRDDRKGVFLCDLDSIPYWEILLDRHVILAVDEEPDIEDEIVYSGYREYYMRGVIPPEKISVINNNISDADRREAMRALCSGHLISMSVFTLDCARFYNNNSSLSEYDIWLQGEALSAVLTRLDYNCAGQEEWRDYLKIYGEQGEYTFCDEYCRTGKRLWQQLIGYDEDVTARCREKIHNFIESKFPFAENLYTGGFEIYD